MTLERCRLYQFTLTLDATRGWPRMLPHRSHLALRLASFDSYDVHSIAAPSHPVPHTPGDVPCRQGVWRMSCSECDAWADSLRPWLSRRGRPTTQCRAHDHLKHSTSVFVPPWLRRLTSQTTPRHLKDGIAGSQAQFLISNSRPDIKQKQH